MNLWVRALRQLAVLAVALFFFSCQDETSILGFKDPNEKLKVNFVDIPLESSEILVDSLRTSNLFNTTEVNRLLVGTYSDDKFGQISASAITQFFTTNLSKTLLKETAVLDSVSIQLQFDFYNYGSLLSSSQSISVHEINRELMTDSVYYYFNKSNTPYSATPLGSKTFAISPDQFNKFVDESTDTAISINFPLDLDFGRRIFSSAMQYRGSSTGADSTFVRSDFFKEFKGIAITPESGDKIIGFNPDVALSKIILHYHDAETDSLELALAFTHVVGFSEITADRSSTPLAGLTQYSQPVIPTNNQRYIQCGTGVLTRLDFQKFYDFVDADSNSTMIVNSAELSLGTPEPSASLAPINSLSLRAVKGESGYLKKLADRTINKAEYLADSAAITLYAGQLGIVDKMFTPMDGSGSGSIFTISKSGSDTFYSGFFTLFAQELFKREANKARFRYFALYPESPQIGRSVNRIIFDKDNIKLRVFYSRPTQPLQ